MVRLWLREYCELIDFIQPLSSLLPNVSPIHDLQVTTKRLHRADRIYGIANLLAVTTLATSLVYTFLTSISVF
jgi:hypothetical protein